MFSLWDSSEREEKFLQATAKLWEGNAFTPKGDNRWWEDLWKVPLSREGIWLEFSPENVHNLKRDRPSTMSALIIELVEVLDKYSQEETLQTDAQKGEVMGAVRLLTRCMPFLFEGWTTLLSHSGEDKPGSKQQISRRYILDGSDKEPMKSTSLMDEKSHIKSSNGNIIKKGQSKVPDSNIPRCLADKLLDAIMRLMFVRAFTVSVDVDDGLLDRIWSTGLACGEALPSDNQMDGRRTELLTLLLTCLSQGLYCTQGEYRAADNRWLVSFTTHQCNDLTATFFFSLINTICQYDPVGYGIPFPYLQSANSKEPLTLACLHTLLVLLDFSSQPPFDNPPTHGPGLPGTESNIYLQFIMDITDKYDMTFVFDSLTDLVRSPLRKRLLPLPGLYSPITFTSQLLMLIWRLLDYNKTLLQHVVGKEKTLDLLEAVLYYGLEARQDIVKLGTVHVAAFIILLLSGERTFGVSLKKLYTNSLLDVPPFTGHYGDLLILAIHKLITIGDTDTTDLYDNLLIVISNVTPYFKTISKAAATKLLSLVVIFSKPSYFCASPQSPNRVYFLLEALNNLIHYQLAGSTHIVYGVIRRRSVFELLSTFSTTSLKGTVQKHGEEESKQESEKGKGNLSMTEDKEEEHVDPTYVKDKEKDKDSRAGIMVDVSPCQDRQSQSRGASPYHPEPDHWVATPEWIQIWQSRLPLQTILRLIHVMGPRVEDMCTKQGVSDEQVVMDFLNNDTLVGLLPVPHPIVSHKYNTIARTFTWLS
eukprot:Ihof_evm11s26 gene=Ihof_evmTU11s26